MTRLTSYAVAAAAVLAASSAWADFAKIDDQSKFVSLVTGKTLTRPFVTLQVSPDGRIAGKGAAWAVNGTWSWQAGYFCRDINWGGDDLGYNCQEVQATGNRIRFTSDKGTGDSAEFRLK